MNSLLIPSQKSQTQQELYDPQGKYKDFKTITLTKVKEYTKKKEGKLTTGFKVRKTEI